MLGQMQGSPGSYTELKTTGNERFKKENQILSFKANTHTVQVTKVDSAAEGLIKGFIDQKINELNGSNVEHRVVQRA